MSTLSQRWSGRSVAGMLAGTVALALAATISGCGPAIEVRTQAAPNADLAARHTFRIMETPAPNGLTLRPDDPMLDNSMTYRAIREDIRADFISRGYIPNANNPDFTIAYYATTQPRLDITSWNYGYSWRGWPREWTEVTPYEQGTVLIDVVDAKTRELVWRGRSRAAVSTNPSVYESELSAAVKAIVNKYPTATHVGLR
ncbi:MAG TPA: DUF4136 domain-containing protein [Gemmatimonadaceae bacterium]|nr:DUF4136 domain-containing protein [Gemmatimonadaceae bacterium]